MSESCFMSATKRRGNRITVGMKKSIFTKSKPGKGPFEFLSFKLNNVSKWLREEQAFDSIDALKTQINQDIEQARHYFDE